jgi:hypothetical protein
LIDKTNIHPEAFLEPENRIGLLYVAMMKKYVHKKKYRSGVSSIFFADENVSPMYFGYYMQPHLNDIITLKAGQLQQSGILTRLLHTYEGNSKPEEIGPQVLTLRHLEASFVVIFCLLASSVAVFAVEIAPKLSKKLWTWLRKAVFFYVVVKFAKMNKLM